MGKGVGTGGFEKCALSDMWVPWFCDSCLDGRKSILRPATININRMWDLLGGWDQCWHEVGSWGTRRECLDVRRANTELERNTGRGEIGTHGLFLGIFPLIFFFSVVFSAHTLRCYPPLQQPIVSSSPHFFSTMLLFCLKTPLSESFDAGVSQYLKASQTELLFCLCLKVSLEARSEWGLCAKVSITAVHCCCCFYFL